MVGGGACLMNFTAPSGAGEGSIAPTGGCPANFFTSRKWTFEHAMLIIRDHKGEALAELSRGCKRLVELLFFESPPVPYDDVAKTLGMAKGSMC